MWGIFNTITRLPGGERGYKLGSGPVEHVRMGLGKQLRPEGGLIGFGSRFPVLSSQFKVLSFRPRAQRRLANSRFSRSLAGSEPTNQRTAGKSENYFSPSSFSANSSTFMTVFQFLVVPPFCNALSTTAASFDFPMPLG